ncbi:MAG: carbohydrate kinase family protein [bacterium]|nr:carbohydrate kinase family protein [bacterium]
MYDLVAIGETTIDAFIKLENADVQCDIDKENCQICLPFAAKIPYEFAIEIPAVGNAGNASVSASRLGLKSALVANVGKDSDGEKCLNTLKLENVATEFIAIHENEKTNYHYVLWYDDDRTILQKHSKFKYNLPDIAEPKWIYLTSLGEDSLDFHTKIIEYLNIHPNIHLAFQPGIFQMNFGKEKLKNIYERSNIFFCNVGEAEKILSIDTLGITELLRRMYALGPKMVVITDGSKGAHVFDGKDVWFQLPYPDPKPPYERTGAGDAFASTTVAALALDHDLPTALSWGAINSMSVVQQVGAQKGLLTRPQIEKYLKDAPTNFLAKQLK